MKVIMRLRNFNKDFFKNKVLQKNHNHEYCRTFIEEINHYSKFRIHQKKIQNYSGFFSLENRHKKTVSPMVKQFDTKYLII